MAALPTGLCAGPEAAARLTHPGDRPWLLPSEIHLALKFYRSLIQAPPASYPQVIPKHNMFGVMGTVGGAVLPSLAQLVLPPVKEPGDHPYRFG